MEIISYDKSDEGWKSTFMHVPEFCMETLEAWADGDVETMALLLQTMGYAIATGSPVDLQPCVLLVGDDQSGKDEFLELLEHLVGGNNCAHLSMNDLSDRFKPAELVGKMLNTYREPTINLKKTDGLLNVTRRDYIWVEERWKDPIKYPNTAKMIFASDDIPRLDDRIDSVQEGLIFVPFSHTFEKNNTLAEDMVKPENIQGFLTLATIGARYVYNKREFIEPVKSKLLREKFKAQNKL